MITKIALVNRSGMCRWCQCTDWNGCGAGCSWVDRAHTLCSECETLDHAMRSARGRKALAAFVQLNVRDWDLLENP